MFIRWLRLAPAAMFQQMVAINLRFIRYLVSENGYHHFAIIRSNVLTNGCCCLHYLVSANAWPAAMHEQLVTTNVQLIQCTVVANGCYRFAVICDNMLANGCYKFAVYPLPCLNKWCYQFAVSRSNVLANGYYQIANCLLPCFSNGCYQLEFPASMH